MKIIILTCNQKGIASRLIKNLKNEAQISELSVVYIKQPVNTGKRFYKRKLTKIIKIGLLGTLNGLRMRKWFIDHTAKDIKSECLRYKINYCEFTHYSSSDTIQFFKNSQADLCLSLGNSFIPEKLFCIPKYGSINLHTEILPEFKGAQSIIWSVYKGKRTTGYTLHKVAPTIDGGDIVLQKKMSIDFNPKLKQTVQCSIENIRKDIVKGIIELITNFEYLYQNSKKQKVTQSYTTPTYLQFLKMKKMNKQLYLNEKKSSTTL